MRISGLAVARPVTTLMAFVAVVVLGVVAYRQLPVQLFPDITVPTIGMWVGKPESSTPEVLEELTKPIEGIISELPKVRRVRSYTNPDGVWLVADFDFNADIRFLTIDLQERLNAFQQTLEDRRTNIQVFPFSTDQFNNFLMQLSVEGPEEGDALFELVRRRIQPQLESVSGVAKIEVGGLTSDAADVEIDPNRLAGFGLEFGSVFQRIQAAGTNDTYLGRIRTEGETYYVRLDDPVRNVAELRRVNVDGRGVVDVEDVANVTQGGAIDGWVYRSNGNYAIGIQVDREQGENLIQVAGKVRERIDDINATLPPGFSVEVETDVAELVQGVINQVRNLALIGAALALLVPLIFFRSWRIASIIFISVPICIIAVFNLFYAFGVSINILSIIGLALGVGMLVDNSIVVVENCFRLYFHKRMDAVDAATLGGNEVGRALFASTLTTVAPFTSFFFIDGEFKLFVKEPTLALVFPLMVSLVVALTLSATMTSRMLATIVRHRGARGAAERERAGARLEPKRSRFREAYRYVLKACLRRRGRVVTVIIAVLAFVFFDACDRVREAPTNQDRYEDVFRFYLQMPAGSKLSQADATVRYVEDRLKEHPDVDRFSAWFQSNQANFNVYLLPAKDRPTGRTLGQVRSKIVEFIGEVPNGEVSLVPPNQPIASNNEALGDRGQIILKGLDLAVVEVFAGRLVDALSGVPEVVLARIDRDDDQPEYHAVLDREKTRLFGVTAQTVAQMVGVSRASGTISSLVLNDGEDRTDVTISIADSNEDDSLAAVKDTPIFTQLGFTTPLGEIANFEMTASDDRIRRVDRQESLAVEYFWAPGANQGAILDRARELLRTLPNPGGVTHDFEGQSRKIDERQRDAVFILTVSILLIYVVMAAVFESFWVPLAIVCTNPLMIIGIVIALAVTGLPFDDLAFFGVVLLNGLAVNNGIVLLDMAMRYQREHNFRRLRAVFQAADHRLRPITMTFMTTTLGLLPLAITGDESSQWRPVAVTVLGGLTSATVLTLLVLPCFYLIGDDAVGLLGRGLRGTRRWFEWIAGRCEDGKWRRRFTAPARWVFRDIERNAMLWRGMVLALPFFGFRAVRGFLREGRRLFPTPRRVVAAIVGDAARVVAAVAAWTVPRRLRHWARRKATSPATTAGAAPALITAASRSLDAPPLDFRSVRVIYPDTGWKAAKRVLPRKGVPLGRAPVTGVEALGGVTLTIEPGLFGLLGPNGAGKTTLMRAAAGLLEPTRGTVRVFGATHRESGPAIAPLVGYLPQTHGLYEWMTLYEYLDYFATLTARTLQRASASGGGAGLVEMQLSRLVALQRRGDRVRAIQRAAEEVHLEDFLHERVGSFSGGMKQRAGFARLLLQSPPILIVDEPTAGLDPVERVKVRLLLSQLAQSRTVIFSTHIVEDLEHACDQLGVLARGRLVFSGTPAELLRRWDGRVWEAAVAGDGDAEVLRDRLARAGARVLSRYARGEGEGLRFLGTADSCTGARRVEPTLEDALLGSLDPGAQWSAT